jgi:hypothetical protein
VTSEGSGIHGGDMRGEETLRQRKKNHPYRAYLLRCWQEGSHWRFSAEEVLHKQPRRGFDSLGALVAFLQAELVGNEDRPLAVGEKRQGMD